MNLGLLVFSAGNSHDIEDVLNLAVEADALGFSRFWLGEHYTSTDWNNPEVLLPVILGLTRNIRVGAAGILLRLHSAFRVACTFKLMHSIFPDRIDLGVGAGLAPNAKAIRLLTNIDTDHFGSIDYNKKLEELLEYFTREDELFEEGVIVAPYKIPPPPLWLLSGSNNGLIPALNHKANMSRSLFHQSSNPEPERDKLEAFKEAYFLKYGEMPQVNLAFAGICAPTIAKAKRRFQQSYYADNTFIVPNILGTPESFQDTLHSYQELFGVDEFVFLDMSDEQEDRMESIGVLSRVFGLRKLLDSYPP